MKQVLIIILLFQLLWSCNSHDRPKPSYDYVKIMLIGENDTGNAYNKGKGIGGYFYYNPNNDSVILRTGIFLPTDSLGFQTYVGQLENTKLADTITMLIDFLKRHKNGELSRDYSKPTTDNNDAPLYSVEYVIDGQSHFISFEFLNDTLKPFYEIFARIKETQRDQQLVPNNWINETEETVHMLKGLGIYDSIIYTPPYIPLPCEKGIKMELLYGKWRTIGDKYNNANLTYNMNIIGKDGSWKVERFSEGELEPRFSGKIMSIDKDYIIKVKIKNEITTIQILNLTENCLEYEVEGSYRNSTWRFDRMK